MKILVTGARGMLGQDLVSVLARCHQVIPVDIQDFDITRPDCLREISARKPQFVAHLAAMTNVDGCEREPAKAYLVNQQGTRLVAQACRDLRIPLLYISTDFVFDGTKSEPYREEDPPHPLGHYGRSKLAGEEAVRELLSSYFIVRISWLFGPHGKNFVSTILSRAVANGEVKVVDDQIGSPTYTRDLSPALAQLIATRNYGIYHLTNSGSCSWYQLAAEAVRLAGLGGRVVPIKSSEYPTPTRRPAYSVLGNFRWQEKFGTALRPWQQALAEYVEWWKGQRS
jgi:dTDP-4-dehydrorhamnose reductase